MKLYEFNQNIHEQRAELVDRQGEYLAERLTKEHLICLYSMGTFFAEVWYRTKVKEIALVRGFTNVAMLEPYLDLIKLPETAY